MTMPFWLSRSTWMVAKISIRSGWPSRGRISSTVTAVECGNSSLQVGQGRLADQFGDPMSCGSSVVWSSAYSDGPTGTRWSIRVASSST